MWGVLAVFFISAQWQDRTPIKIELLLEGSQTGAAQQKIRPRNLNIWLIRPYFNQKSDQKRTQTDYFWGPDRTCSKNLIQTLGKLTFIDENKINFSETIKLSMLCVEGWKSENQTFLDFLGQLADFSSKKRTNFKAFKKRSAIRPRSDKADQTYLASLQTCVIAIETTKYLKNLPFTSFPE